MSSESCRVMSCDVVSYESCRVMGYAKAINSDAISYESCRGHELRQRS